MIYDTHAHLNLNYSDEEIDDLINESKKNKLFVNIIGVDIANNLALLVKSSTFNVLSKHLLVLADSSITEHRIPSVAK